MTTGFSGHERLEPPEEYVAHLNHLGGINRYGDPNFILVWGQTRTWTIYGKNARGFKGQHIVLQYGGVPAWHLMAWKPPECFGTPELWRALTWDEETKTHGLGEYPYRGDYVPCKFNLYTRRVMGGGFVRDEKTGELTETEAKLVIDAMPLCHWILDLIIPNVMKDLETTYWQRRIAVRNRMAAQQKQASQQAFDAYRNANPAWGGKSSSKESNREAQMQRIREKQKISAEAIKKIMGTGHKVF